MRQYHSDPLPRNRPADGGYQPHQPPPPVHHHHQALDLFPNGGFVRLESRVRTGMYVHADGDWEKVSLRRGGAVPALNSVWRVEHWVYPDPGIAEPVIYVALQNAAFGRYLSYSKKKAQRGHRGFRTAQRDRTEPDVGLIFHAYPWIWEVQRLNPPDQAFVILRYETAYLRANGRYLRWNIRVTAEVDLDMPLDADDELNEPTRSSTMMHWTVHPVAQSPAPQPLPLILEEQGNEGGPLFPRPPRTVRHVQANDAGEFDQNHHNWPSFVFYDSSVLDLMDELRLRQHWNEDNAAYTLCMRPGLHGRLMPLATDVLPASLDPMNIVVFRTASQAAVAFRYPAPPPPADDA